MHDVARMRTMMHSRTTAKYISMHHRRWYQHAIKAGYKCKPGDIVFVRGWVKTTEWSIAAFQSIERDKSLTRPWSQSGDAGSGQARLHGQLNYDTHAAESASLSFTGSDWGSRPRFPVQHELRSGRGASEGRRSWGIYRSDQCVFLPVYKLKYRLSFLKTIEVAGGPREPPMSDEDTDSGSSTRGSSRSASSQADVSLQTYYYNTASEIITLV